MFLTNKLPSVRQKLKIGVDEIRAHNPDIIYVRGTGQGERGPDADKGSYDSLAFWARSGVAVGAKRPEYDLMPVPPAPGFGDSIGAMTIAGGILGALFHRERTGEATIVDVSLLGVGLWAMGQAVALSLVLGTAVDAAAGRPPRRPIRCRATTRPRTAGCWPSPACSPASTGRPCARPSAARSWPPTPGSPTTQSLMANSAEAIGILTEVFASATLDEWRERLATFIGQWAVVQDTLEAVADPQTVANGYVQECQTAAGTPFRLVAAPVQFDEEPAVPTRAPEFNEHGDSILADLGLDSDAIIDLKIRGVVA